MAAVHSRAQRQNDHVAWFVVSLGRPRAAVRESSTLLLVRQLLVGPSCATAEAPPTSIHCRSLVLHSLRIHNASCAVADNHPASPMPSRCERQQLNLCVPEQCALLAHCALVLQLARLFHCYAFVAGLRSAESGALATTLDDWRNSRTDAQNRPRFQKQEAMSACLLLRRPGSLI